jgi:hypothetical protein
MVAAELAIIQSAKEVQKVYPTDQHIREFLGHSIHALAAAAETPFLTTGLRADFRWGCWG